MLLALTFLLLLKTHDAGAAPIPEPAKIDGAKDPFTNGPNYRTVFNILWSCSATTFACTWLSVHPNVPFKKEGKWTARRRRLFLMVLAILAPEIMVMWAFKQWRGAAMITKAINDAYPDARWTITHGHFLQMGGFRVVCTKKEVFFTSKDGVLQPRKRPIIDKEFLCPVDDERGSISSASNERYVADLSLCPDQALSTTDLNDDIWESVITFDAMKQILSDGSIPFPTITIDEIMDRSKSDAFSKGVAFLQLAWFIVQLIARTVCGLQITELELTTAALASLNSVMYIFWWDKPLDVYCPMAIHTKGAIEVRAERAGMGQIEFKRNEFSLAEYLRGCATRSHRNSFCSLNIPRLALRWFTSLGRSLVSRVYALFVKVRKYFTESGRLSGDAHPRHAGSEGLESSAPGDQTTSSMDLARTRDTPVTNTLESEKEAGVFSRIMQMTEYQASRFGDHAPPALRFLWYFPVLIMITPIYAVLGDPNDVGGMGNTIRMMLYSEDAEPRPLFVASTIAGALFGATHCLAWNFSFPTDTEQMMWRISSLSVVGTCAIASSMVFLFTDAVAKFHGRLPGTAWPLSASFMPQRSRSLSPCRSST